MFPDYFCDDVFRIETQRLWLRWPTAADAATIERLAGEEEIARHTARIPHPYPAGGGQSFVLFAREANAAGKELHLTLATKQRPATAIGMISLEGAGDNVQIGYWLGQIYWGSGFMREAVAGLLDMVWLATGIERIEANVALANPRSRRVLEDAGFVAGDELLAEAPARGASVPARRYALARPIPRFGAARPETAGLSRCCAGM